MPVLTNYIKQGHGKFPLLDALPRKITHSIPYEGRTIEFYFRTKIATAGLDPNARGGLLPHTIHHVGPLNTDEVPVAHKFTQLTNTEHLTMILLFVAMQTGLQMKKP
jgi:hypothetical protein